MRWSHKLRRRAVIAPIVSAAIGSLMAIAVTSAAAASPDVGFYTCPPCGCADDKVKHDAAGACPSCGMAMVFRTRLPTQTDEVERVESASTRRRNVAILVFPGVQIIDYTAPYEVFGQAGFNVYTVAQNTEPLQTAMKMTVVPAYSLAEAPAADIVVVPGGGVRNVEDNAEVLDWLRRAEKESESVLTVCNGAFLAARAGLLDGKSATTFYRLISSLRATAPEVNVVSDRRFVDNGRIVTTAGLSSGIDGSLHVVAKLLGKSRAQRIALNLEYNWLDDVTYARASFADRMLSEQTIISQRHYPLLAAGESRWELLDTRGDASRWQLEWLVDTGSSAAQILELWEGKLTADGGWRRTEAQGGQSRWTFTDGAGSQWHGSVEVRTPNVQDRERAHSGGSDGDLVVILSVERKGT